MNMHTITATVAMLAAAVRRAKAVVAVVARTKKETQASQVRVTAAKTTVAMIETSVCKDSTPLI